jgi:hypothetical protein
MRILVVSLLYPLPGNAARGTFVADHVQALRKDGHEVRVVNPLPRMMRYQEARRSTLTGAARAPREFDTVASKFLHPVIRRYPNIPGRTLPHAASVSKPKKSRSGLENGNPKSSYATHFGLLPSWRRLWRYAWEFLGLESFMATILMSV